MKTIIRFLCTVCLCAALCAILPAQAAAYSYTIVKGDSLWKIAVRTQTGLSELISYNPHIANPALIYPGDVITIPEKDQTAESFAAEVVRLVNERRAANGLSALQTNWELARVAQYKAQDMRDNRYFSHTSPTYGSPFDMMKGFGIRYRYAAENIAQGYTSPSAVVEGWMNSPGHRANILNANYTTTGVGYSTPGHYWSQMFTA